MIILVYQNRRVHLKWLCVREHSLHCTHEWSCNLLNLLMSLYECSWKRITVSEFVFKQTIKFCMCNGCILNHIPKVFCSGACIVITFQVRDNILQVKYNKYHPTLMFTMEPSIFGFKFWLLIVVLLHFLTAWLLVIYPVFDFGVSCNIRMHCL